MKLITALAVVVAGCDEAYAKGAYCANEIALEQVTLVAAQGPLTAENGMTRYTFDKDSANTSNCYESCAQDWPPYLASAYASKDGAPGDTNSDGAGGVWHIAK